jgi:hypothetical protein
MRYDLLLQLVAALAGAPILVNPVSDVQGALHLGKSEYGWVMGAFSIDATLAAALLNWYATPQNRLKYLAIGSLIITLAVLPANLSNIVTVLLILSTESLVDIDGGESSQYKSSTRAILRHNPPAHPSDSEHRDTAD